MPIIAFKRKLMLGVVALLLIFSCLQGEETGKGEFTPTKWELRRARIVNHLGRKALMGTAFLKGVMLKDGVIEVDIATADRKTSYPGLLFRVKDAANYERFYIRPHRSPFYDDALQYGPTFNGVDSWQLYNGPGLTSGLDIIPDRWNHLKIVVSGNQARVFWNDKAEPALVVENLVHDARAGTIGLSGPMDGSAHFSNLRFAAAEEIALPQFPGRTKMPGIISSWELSEPYALIKSDFTHYPRDMVNKSSWKAVEADCRGLVDISRHHGRRFRAGDVILARTKLKSATDTILHTGFGYSDYISVYLNGNPLYFGNSAYRSRDRSFLGILGYHDNLFLPLRKGENELLVMVGESMGGWGFCFRKEDEIISDPSLQHAWENTGDFAFPEAVVYDPGHDVLYVSNYFNEGREFISRISTAGKMLDREWIKGLRMPTGMHLHKEILYAVDRSGLNLINVQCGKITKKIPLPGVSMANDVTMDESGRIYISDTRAGKVYRYSGGKLEAWLTDLNRPNALHCEKKRLLVGQNGKITAVDLKTREKSDLALFESSAGIDGIAPDCGDGLFVSDHNGKLYHLTGEKEPALILDTSTPGEKIADFAYIPKLKRLIIPTFSSNTLTAYSFKQVKERKK